MKPFFQYHHLVNMDPWGHSLKLYPNQDRTGLMWLSLSRDNGRFLPPSTACFSSSSLYHQPHCVEHKAPPDDLDKILSLALQVQEARTSEPTVMSGM